MATLLEVLLRHIGTLKACNVSWDGTHEQPHLASAIRSRDVDAQVDRPGHIHHIAVALLCLAARMLPP